MEKLLERCAALDVHKRQVTACAHVPNRRGERFRGRARGWLGLSLGPGVRQR